MNMTKSQIYIITQGEDGATQTIILLAVNCNKFQTIISKIYIKAFTFYVYYVIIPKVTRKFMSKS